MTTTRSATTGLAVPVSPSAAEPTASASPVDIVPERPSVGAIRASNAEREETIALLHAAVGEGRLDLDEAEERIAAVYGFQYREELPAVLQDLPAGGDRQPPGDLPTWSSIWASVVWRVLMVLHGGAVERPTAKQSRTGVIITAAAALWFLAFVAIGAGVMA
jgi:hypothetical protein